MVRHDHGVFFRLLKSSVCVSTSVFCAAFPVRMFVFAGRLPGLDRWPLPCWRVGGRPWAAGTLWGPVGAGRECSVVRSHHDLQGGGLPFHSREDGAQRALLEAGSAQRRSQRLKPGSLAPGPTLPASTRTPLLLKKGDPPRQSSPSRAACSYPCFSLVSGFRIYSAGGKWRRLFCAFYSVLSDAASVFCRGSQDQTCSSLSPLLSEEAAGVTPGPPCPSASC